MAHSTPSLMIPPSLSTSSLLTCTPIRLSTRHQRGLCRFRLLTRFTTTTIQLLCLSVPWPICTRLHFSTCVFHIPPLLWCVHPPRQSCNLSSHTHSFLDGLLLFSVCARCPLRHPACWSFFWKSFFSALHEDPHHIHGWSQTSSYKESGLMTGPWLYRVPTVEAGWTWSGKNVWLCGCLHWWRSTIRKSALDEDSDSRLHKLVRSEVSG